MTNLFSFEGTSCSNIDLNNLDKYDLELENDSIEILDKNEKDNNFEGILKSINKAITHNDKLNSTLFTIHNKVRESIKCSMSTNYKSNIRKINNIEDISFSKMIKFNQIDKYSNKNEETTIKERKYDIISAIELNYPKEVKRFEESTFNLELNLQTESKAKLKHFNLEKINKYDEHLKYIEELQNELTCVKQELVESDELRLQLHKYIEESKGNIRAYLRIKQNISNDKILIQNKIKSDQAMELVYLQNSNEKYYFNKVFTEEYTQNQIFIDIQPLIISSLDGENISLIAYGATGSGKTYTMQGELNNENKGILPRTAELIFSELKRRENCNKTYNLYFSAIEIYNENIYDLLSSERVKKQMLNNQVKSLTYLEIKEISDVVTFINKASENRSVESTSFNNNSSRSHAIFQLKLEHVYSNKLSFVNIVDLAGSEKCSNSKNIERSPEDIERMKKIALEGSFINKSLVTLGRIINILVKKGKEIPPYRESKLTLLLQNSLNSNNKTVLIATVCNSTEFYSQTKDTLNFTKSAVSV